MKGRELLAALAVKYQGTFEDILEAIKNKEKFTDEEVKEYLNKIKSNYLTILDDEYPLYLKQMYKPPLVLFYYGNLDLLKSEEVRVGVIGSRECSEYGKNITDSFVTGLASQNRIIVSGLARGIDSVAHEACIKSNGKTIAVLGSGIDYPYPNSSKALYEVIKKGHLVVSEYPCKIEPKPSNFPSRNRIVAGIADKILVTEAYENSGTSITVFFALKQGKDVLAIPYPANKNSGCNKFIQDGAFLVDTLEDALFYTSRKN